MYNFMIVDDEIISQLGIVNIINWEENGFNLVAKVKTGEEALEVIKNNEIHLVLTDVNMPIMNGIDLIRECKNSYPSIYFILISSHNDYEYVREGLQLGALDYFLKMDMSCDAITECVRKAKEKLESTDYGINARANMSSFELSTMRSAFIKNLMFNRIYDIEYFVQKCNEYQIKMPFDKFCVASFTFIQREVASNGGITPVIFSIITDILKDFEYGYLSETSLGEISILLNYQDNNKLSNVDDLLERIVLCAGNYLNQNTCIYVSDVMTSVTDIPLAYLQISKAKLFQNLNSSGIHHCSNILSLEYQRQEHDIDNLLLKLENVKSNSLQDFIAVFEETIEYIESIEFIDAGKLFYSTKSIIRITSEYCEYINPTQITSVYFEFDDETLTQLLSNKEIIVQVMEALKQTVLSLKENQDNNYIVRNVKQIIQQEYNKKLSIGELAKQLNVSHSYLSSLFKKQTNMSIKEYLLQIQLQHAKELLKSSTELISQIAVQVGYDNEYQFSKIFKQKIGITPTQYRNDC